MSENDKEPRNNGAVLTIAQIIKAVMPSAAEAELGGLYIGDCIANDGRWSTRPKQQDSRAISSYLINNLSNDINVFAMLSKTIPHVKNFG